MSASSYFKIYDYGKRLGICEAGVIHRVIDMRASLIGTYLTRFMRTLVVESENSAAKLRIMYFGLYLGRLPVLFKKFPMYHRLAFEKFGVELKNVHKHTHYVKWEGVVGSKVSHSLEISLKKLTAEINKNRWFDDY